MKTDDLRDALAGLAGADPPVDVALQRVTTRARSARVRSRVGIAALTSLLVAGAVVGAAQLRTNDRHLLVTRLSPGSVDELTWTRVAAPGMRINRIVTADGRTFAVGSSADGRAAIAQLSDNPSVASVDPTAGYDRPRLSGTVNDLVAIPGALVAVGESAAAKDAPGTADAWRSTDGGRTWDGVALETRGVKYSTIDRVVSSGGAVYAVGTQSASNTDPADLECPIAIWRSVDGTDFHFTSAPSTCGGAVDAVTGPAGLVVITPNNATAWHKAGPKWAPRSVAGGIANSFVSGTAADANAYVAVGTVAPTGDVNDSSGAIWWSADGQTWKQVLTVTGPGRPPNRRAAVTGVAHSAAGWVAVGWQDRVDNPNVTDALVWTSVDGKTWHRSTRDGNTFEQYATAQGVGVTAHGFAIRGVAHMDWAGPPFHLFAGDQTIWLGSTAPDDIPRGTVDGRLQEVGGPAPGLARGVPGTLTATGPGGTRREMTANNGTFTAHFPPGTYTIVGHSPRFGNGKYDCPAERPVIVRANSVTHVNLICPVD